MTRLSTSVSLDPKHKEAIENSDYALSEFVQHAVENGLIDGDMYSLLEALGEKEQEQFEEFADALEADAEQHRDRADDLEADAEQHRQKADNLEARAKRFRDLLDDTTDAIEETVDDDREDWKDDPDAEQTVDEAIDQLRNHDGMVEAEVLEQGPNHPRVETAAEKSPGDAAQLASYAIDEIDPDDVEQKFSASSWPPEHDWPPEWYVEPDAR
jgi:chromosome segregation ATPase